MTKKLKVGIVGCGGVVQQTHIPAFLRLKDVILQAVCDKDESLAKKTAGKFRIPGAYPNLSDMLAAEKLDIVDICTPPQTHAPLAIEAQQHGCHVLMEKPMALKTSDCDDMLNASHKNGTKLCIIHNRLFNPTFLKARELVNNGVIGDFIGMRIFLSDHRDEMIMKKDYWIHKLPGGLVGETGPHFVYMSLAFLNQVKNVDIYAKNFLEHPWAPFDEFRIELEGEKAMSSITLSYTSNRHNSYIDILGTERILHLDLSSMLLVHYGEKASSRPIPFARYLLITSSQIAGGVATNAFKLMTGTLKFGHETLIEKFIDSIINQQQPPVTGEEGRETVRVMEMLVERLQEKYGI
ncbi:Gfo/Idh/MocA family protein [Chloroflexota bacterium]